MNSVRCSTVRFDNCPSRGWKQHDEGAETDKRQSKLLDGTLSDWKMNESVLHVPPFKSSSGDKLCSATVRKYCSLLRAS
ncbi:hypothetical protein Gasu2_25320 [Galdieria sulphuraria]|nr:hypothetical protein Gasu2_25320 [Galdieria sulphuraria]